MWPHSNFACAQGRRVVAHSQTRHWSLPRRTMRLPSRSFTSSFDASKGDKPKNSEELVERMRSRFSETDHQQHSELGSAWEDLWKDGLTPWDLGSPTPALRSELESHWNSTPVELQFRTLVPGCGAGYDLITLARHHEQWLACHNASASGEVREAVVVGLDISETSLGRASSVLKAGFGDEVPANTRVDLVQADFFGSDGGMGTTVCSCGGKEESTMARKKTKWDEHFDFIFDYTFFVALPPTLRRDWGERTAQLLTPGTGRLLTFMFPLNDNPTSPTKGPPFPVSVDDYRNVLEPHGVFMEELPYANPDTIPPRRGKELVCWWRRDKPLPML